MKRLAAAVVAVALASGGAVGALRSDPTTQTLAPVAALPTLDPLPTPGPTFPPTPTALPTASPIALPTPTALPSLRPTLPVVTALPTLLPTAVPLPSQGHWTKTEDGVTLDVTMRPAYPRAGDLVTFTIVTSSTGKECCRFDLAFGDHQGAREGGEYCLAQGDRAPAGDDTFVARHAYRLPGSYTPWIQIGANCSTGPAYFGIKPTFLVGPGPLLSNGPLKPVVSLDDSIPMEGDPGGAGQWFNGYVADHDGYPVSWTWTWGDGTTTTGRNAEACRSGPYGNFTDQDSSLHVPHRFARTGTFTVTLTVVSAGCDGLQRQTASASMEWVVEPQDPGAPKG